MNYGKIVRWGLAIKVAMFAAVCIISRVNSVDATPTPAIAVRNHFCACVQCCESDSDCKLSQFEAACAEQQAIQGAETKIK